MDNNNDNKSKVDPSIGDSKIPQVKVFGGYQKDGYLTNAINKWLIDCVIMPKDIIDIKFSTSYLYSPPHEDILSYFNAMVIFKSDDDV